MEEKDIKNLTFYNKFKNKMDTDYGYLFDSWPDIDFSDDEIMQDKYGMTGQEFLDVFKHIHEKHKIIVLPATYYTGEPKAGDPAVIPIGPHGDAYFDPEAEDGAYGVLFIVNPPENTEPHIVFSQPVLEMNKETNRIESTGMYQAPIAINAFRSSWSIPLDKYSLFGLCEHPVRLFTLFY